MNLDELRRRLVAAARLSPTDDQVPYAFEKRVMARLRVYAPLDMWAVWARALWRAAASCVMLTLLLAAWCLLAPVAHSPANGTASVDVAQQLENTVLAAADQDLATDAFR